MGGGHLVQVDVPRTEVLGDRINIQLKVHSMRDASDERYVETLRRNLLEALVQEVSYMLPDLFYQSGQTLRQDLHVDIIVQGSNDLQQDLLHLSSLVARLDK